MAKGKHMKKLFTLLVLVLSMNILSYSQVFETESNSWEFNSHGIFDYGFVHWSSDLGAHTNFTTGLNGLMYNVSDQNSPIVLDGRVFYMNFLGEDDVGRINRQLIGVTAGVGLHVQERLFATVNVGHMWVMNEMKGERQLTSLMASGKLMAVILKMPHNWNVIVNLEAGMTFQDIEFRDPTPNINGSSPDKFMGTGFMRLGVGFSYYIGSK